MKKCTKCKETKCTTDFVKRKRNKDGLDSWCKLCNGENKKRWPNAVTIVRLKALEVLGNVCVRCGFDDVRALQIDHVNGGGSQERLKEDNRRMYVRIAGGDTEGYQVLCANCNWIKRSENNENGRYAILESL